MARVLVTRPEPGAAATAARLVERGHEAIILPLTATVPLQPPSIAPDRKFDAVAVTSAAAIRHCPAPLLARFAGLRCFAVGRATADAARAVGFAHPETADGDADALAALLLRRLPQGARLAYLCGTVRTGSLAEHLSAAGIDAVAIETYDTIPLTYRGEELRKCLGTQPIDAVLLHSAASAAAFRTLAGDRNFSRLVERSRLLCISQRVAEVIDSIFPGQRVAAATPDEDALLALLNSAG